MSERRVGREQVEQQRPENRDDQRRGPTGSACAHPQRHTQLQQSEGEEGHRLPRCVDTVAPPCDRNGNRAEQYAENENAGPEPTTQHAFLRTARWRVERTRLARLGAHGHTRKAVGHQIDPEDLRRKQRHSETDKRTDEHDNDFRETTTERVEQEAADVAVDPAPFTDRGDQGAEIVIEQHDIRSLTGHLNAPAAHGHADVGIGLIGLFFIDPANFTPFNASGGSAFGAITAAAALTLWAFIGLESATIPAGDVDDASRTIPWSTIVGTLVTAGVYILGTVAVMGVLAPETLANSNAPFADAAAAIMGTWAGRVVAIAAIVSTFGALNGWILVQAQVPMAAARDGLFPRSFARQSKHGTPVVGLVVSSVLITVLMAMNYTKSLVDQFGFVILLATLTTLIPYSYSAMAEVMLLLKDRQAFSGQRLFKDVVIASLAFAYTAWTIAGSGWDIVGQGFLLLMLGVPVYVWLKARASRALPPADWVTTDGIPDAEYLERRVPGVAGVRGASGTRARSSALGCLSVPRSPYDGSLDPGSNGTYAGDLARAHFSEYLALNDLTNGHRRVGRRTRDHAYADRSRPCPWP